MTRSDAIKILDSIWAKGMWRKTNEIDWNKAGDAIDMATDALKAQDRPKGEWVDENGTYYANCSKCGYQMDTHQERGYFRYCPNCGADMRGEDE